MVKYNQTSALFNLFFQMTERSQALTEFTDGSQTLKPNEWTAELELQCKNLAECAMGYSWMFSRDKERYVKYSRYIWGAQILVGMIISLINLLGLTITDATGWSNSVSLIGGIASAGGSLYMYQKNYTSVISDLKQQIREYNGLSENVRKQLALAPKNRERARDYHTWLAETYNRICSYSMDILPNTLEEYRVIAAEKKLPFPDDTTINQPRILVYTRGNRKRSRQDATEAKQRDVTEKRSTPLTDVFVATSEEAVSTPPIVPCSSSGSIATQQVHPPLRPITDLDRTHFSDLQMKYEMARGREDSLDD